MPPLPTGEPVWDLTFDATGSLTAPSSAQFVQEVADSGIADLFLLSHGWGASQADAQSLFGALFPLIAAAAAPDPAPAPGSGSGSGSGAGAAFGPIGFGGIFWPSLWFPDTPATPPPTGGSTEAAAGAGVGAATGSWAVTGAAIAAALAPGYGDPGQQESIARLGALIDDATSPAAAAESDRAKTQRLDDLQALLASLTPQPPGGSFEDSGETALLGTADPATAFGQTADVFGSAPPASSQQSLGDWFDKAVNGAKDAVRVLSYYTMKARAGTIGQNGLGPLLAGLHEVAPGVRVHLLGHSFGARLVAFALAGIPDAAASPVASLLLLQGAFSHWSFAHAQDNPFGEPGGLNGYADRVHGPLVSTFSSYDWAVGVWYPKASFLADQDTEDVVAGRWGGMGSDGYQAVSPSADLTMPAGGGADYGLVPATFYRVDCDAVIDDVSGQPFAGAHSDIRKPPVAQLAVAAARAHA